MAKLGTVKPRLGGLSDRMQQVSDVGRGQEWRAWYKTARWRALRMQVLKRDRFICQRTGIRVTGKYPAPDSPAVNHKRPHRGDPNLFWDIANLETVSKAVHDSTIQRQERGMIRGTWD